MSGPITRGLGGATLLTRGFGVGAILCVIRKVLHLISLISQTISDQSIVACRLLSWSSVGDSKVSSIGLSEINTQLQGSSTISRVLNLVSHVELP